MRRLFFLVDWRNMLVMREPFMFVGPLGGLVHARMISSAASEARGWLCEWFASFFSFTMLMA